MPDSAAMSDSKLPPSKEFHHIGLRAMEPQPDEDYVPLTRVWVTDPRRHPHRIEYLRYEPDSHLDEDFKNAPHIAYKVEALGPHIAGKDIVLGRCSSRSVACCRGRGCSAGCTGRRPA